MQITELRDAKAENERQTALLSKELQDTKDILHMRNAVLHHNQCDQQVLNTLSGSQLPIQSQPYACVRSRG